MPASRGRKFRANPKAARIRAAIWQGNFDPSAIAKKLRVPLTDVTSEMHTLRKRGIVIPTAPQPASKAALIKAELLAGNIGAKGIAEKLKQHNVSAAYVGEVKSKLRKKGLDIPRGVRASVPYRESSNAGLIRGEIWKWDSETTPESIARKLSRYGVTTKAVYKEMDKLRREGITLPAWREGRGKLRSSTSRAGLVRGEVWKGNITPKSIAEALKEHGVATRNAYDELNRIRSSGIEIPMRKETSIAAKIREKVWLGNFSAEQIAKELGVPISIVHSQLHKLRKKGIILPQQKRRQRR